MKDEITGVQVAQLMECDPGFVRRLRIDGRLPGVRQVGITWLYSRKAVKAFLRTWDRRPGSYERKPAAAAKRAKERGVFGPRAKSAAGKKRARRA